MVLFKFLKKVLRLKKKMKIPLGDGISAASNRLAIFLTGFVFCLTVKWMPIRALLSQLGELRLWGGE